MVRVALTTVCVLLGCTGETPSVSQFPLPVDVEAGPVIVGMEINQDDLLTGVVDTMSPLTIVDSFSGDGEPGAPRRRTLDLGLRSSGPSVAEPVTQARFRGVDTLDLHPCEDPDPDVVATECAVGLDSDARVIQGVLGADILSSYAVRFAIGDGLMSFFPDVAGDDRDRTLMCEAVFPRPFHGAGTLVLGNAERPYSARRIALGGCFVNMTRELEQDLARSQATDSGNLPSPAHPIAGPTQGLDALFVLSTGLGITVVAETTYQEYKEREAELSARNPEPDAMQSAVLHLVSGPIAVRLGTMSHLALVAEVSDQRGPCYERYANLYLADRDDGTCEEPNDIECPCGGDSVACRAGAVVELCGSFPVAVVPDDAPLLQGLRDELRPALPEIDGILGTDIMDRLIIDVDYPNGRVLARCAPEAEGCRVRPAVLSAETTDAALSRCPDQAACSLPDIECSTPTACGLPPIPDLPSGQSLRE